MILVAAMLLSALGNIVPMHAHAASFSQAGGWLESIYAEISGISESSVTAVSYSGTTSGSLTGQDLEYLVRSENGKVRIDIPGVPAGTYTLTVTAGGTTYTQSGIKVLAHDRSGYAHFNYTRGVGAYNDDGSLKSNAIVLYVTNENKNSVTVTSKDGTTVTGIGNILGSTGMDVGTGLNSKGGKANTNQDILRKLAADGTPLVIRIIGNVKGASSTSLSSATSEIDGLTQYDGIDYGGTAGDNGFMARMSGGKDITIEGIGSGATIDGWGLHFICQTADYPAGYGQSFEVRNLSFKNVPEDCIGMEGQQEGSTLTAPVERCWIHNCTFVAPTISSPAESDKDGGDGACDFKRGNYMTMDYCYYEGYHKTNLVGSSDTSLQYHITWHHNYWKGCDSRGPLGRQANMHIYNCIYEGQTSYAMNPRANCYIFSEYNSFINCKNPVEVKSGAVKSYNDSFTSCIEANDATIVTDKSQKVSTNCAYANFDTDSTLSYVPSGDYLLDTDYDTMVRNIKAYAGAMPATIVAPEDIETSKIPSDRMPTAPVALPYSQSLNKTYVAANGTTDNIVFNVAKFNADSLTVGANAAGYDIVFWVDRTVNISMTEVSATYSPVLCAANGKALITGSGTAENVPAGYYYICSSGYDVGGAKYKEAKVASLSIEAVVVHGDNDHVYTEKVTAPTCTEGGYTTYTCACGASYTGNTTPAAGHKPGAAATCVDPQTCTVCGDQIAAAKGHSYSGGVCSACGAIDPNSCAHSDTTTKNAKAATCSAEGYTGDTFCNTCQTTVKTGSAIAKLAHTGGAAATCTTAQTCTVCGATVTAALGHNYVDGVCTRCGAEDLAASGYIHDFTASGKTSTFYTITGNLSTSKGTVNYDGKTLTQCLKIESSTNITFNAPSAGTLTLVFVESGANMKLDGTQVNATNGVITVDVAAGSHTLTKRDTCNLFYMVYAPAGGSTGGDVHTHSYTETVTTAATCETAGVKTFSCSCGASYTQAIPALGHSYSSSVTKAPTCVDAGVRTYACPTCGDSYTESIAATGVHNYVDGACSVCGADDPSDCTHPNPTSVVTAPTCTAGGYTTYTCGLCGYSWQADQTTAKGHTEVSVPGTAATCTAAGTTEGKKCSVCGVTTVAQKPIAALGHNYAGGACTRCGAEETAITVGGWFEAAWAEWESVAGASGYNVYYKAENGNWTQIDTELIRSYGDHWRADVVGLKAGKYQLCVAPVIGGSTGTHMHSDLVTVIAHDRGGYAHVNGTSSGAYNEDGTLKSNAVVVYVTEANKNSVTATIGGASYTGISNILSVDALKTATAPICVRMIGNITDLGSGKAFDKGDLLIQNNNNAIGLTIEGIGEDAVCNGFGIRIKTSSNVEIRNLGSMNCDSSEGDSIGLQQDNDHIWVHNCDVFYGDAGSDADQAKGDGALDTKKSQYVTHSYNHFWDCGKVHLNGNGDTTLNYITYHHNWYDHCDSRMPRVRVSNSIHVYNNFYDGVAKYGIGATTGCSIFSEANYYLNTTRPMMISKQGTDALGDGTFSGEAGGIIKSYGDVMVFTNSAVEANYSFIPYSTDSTNFDAYVATSRNETVPSSVKTLSGGTSYSNFDTASGFYSYNVETAEQAMNSVKNYSGRMGGGDFKWTFTDADDADYAVNSEMKAALVGYKTSIQSIGGNSVTEEHVNCAHPSTTTVTTDATCTATGSTVEKCTECGTVVSTTTIPALGHNYVGGTCSRCGLIDASTCAHSNETSVVTAPTCTEAGYTTYTCTACGTTRTADQVAATGHTAGAAATCTTAQTCTVCGETITAALGHNYVDGVCTRCGAEDLAASGYVHDFTANGKTSTFYTITGNTSTSKGSVTYDSKTLTTCLKMESSTNIAFTAPKAGKLTLVFGGSTAASGKAVKIDGTSYDIDSTQVLTVDVAAGSHTVTKGDSINLFYMVYAPESTGGDVHTHSYTETVTTAATCEGTGVKTFSCSCGDSYTESIPALGHSYSSVVTAPTCTEGGYTTYTCGTCGDSYTGNQTAAKGHSYSSSVTTVPDCTNTGVRTYTCSACGDSYTESIPATGHTEVTIAGKAATCTASGLTDGTKCSVCGEILTAQTVIPALGHTNAAAVKENEKAASCTASGSYDSVVYCSVCRAEVSRTTVTVEATGHTLVTDAAVAPTCTAAGKTEGQHCSVCGEVTIAQQTVAAKGHSFANGVCTVCGAADPEYVAGVTVSGQFVSSGEVSEPVTIQLILEGQTEAAYSFVSDGTAKSGAWSIDGVAAGNYTVKVMKADHVTREYALTVGNTAVTQNVKICLLGDVNNDGNVNISDYVSILTQVKNPGEPVLVDYYRQCADTDSNGAINFMDYLALLSHVKNVNRLW